MEDTPNTDPFKNMPNGYSFSWTQPYYGYTWPDPIKQVNVMNEIARMDFLEEQIQSMLTYPDAEAILNKIKENNK
jgi:hypothetical protein